MLWVVVFGVTQHVKLFIWTGHYRKRASAEWIMFSLMLVPTHANSYTVLCHVIWAELLEAWLALTIG